MIYTIKRRRVAIIKECKLRDDGGGHAVWGRRMSCGVRCKINYIGVLWISVDLIADCISLPCSNSALCMEKAKLGLQFAGILIINCERHMHCMCHCTWFLISLGIDGEEDMDPLKWELWTLLYCKFDEYLCEFVKLETVKLWKRKRKELDRPPHQEERLHLYRRLLDGCLCLMWCLIQNHVIM